jgi:hypothetical protein
MTMDREIPGAETITSRPLQARPIRATLVL